MRHLWLSAAFLLVSSPMAWAIYGPSLLRTDPALAAEACRQAAFPRSEEMAKALKSQNASQAFRLLRAAVNELRMTSTASVLYPSRAFCVHELVPGSLPASDEEIERNRHRLRPEVHTIAGEVYFFYEPDRRWMLGSNPVDLQRLPLQHLDSPWGRQAFLMMTQMGWSHGRCEEGPDQFRTVIRRSEAFLAHYPRSDISSTIRYELANAYATWWYVSREPEDAYTSPDPYKAGASEARQKAIALYRTYRAELATPNAEVDHRLRALEQREAGKSTYDYFCPDYED